MPGPSEFSRRTYLVLVACVTAAAAGIRFWNLSYRSLWIDEGVSVALARMNWSDFTHALWIREANMALYYVVLRGWIHLSSSESGVRSLSVIAAVATIPLVALLGERLFSRRVGLLAAALSAVHVWQIHHAREARGYSLLALLSVLGWLQITRILREPSWRNWLLLSGISVASVYINFFAVLGIVAQFVCLGLARPRNFEWKRGLGALAIVLAGCVPAAIYVVTRDVGQLVWVQKTNGPALLEFFDFLTGGWSGVYGVGVFVLVQAALIVVGLKAIRRSDWATTFGVSVPVIGVLLPVALLLAISAVRPSFVPRYLIYVAVPFVLGIAWLCSRMQNLGFAVAGIAAVCVFLLPLPGYYRQPAFQDFRGASNYLAERAKPGDALVIWEPMARTGIEYYAAKRFPEFQYPRTADHLTGDDIVGRLDPIEMKRRLAEPDRIWLVYNFDEAPKDYGVLPYFFQVQAERGRRLASQATFKNIQVLEYVRP